MSRDRTAEQSRAREARAREETARWLATRLDAGEGDLDRDPWIAADPARRAAARDLLGLCNDPALHEAMRRADMAPTGTVRDDRRPSLAGVFAVLSRPRLAAAGCAVLLALLWIGAGLGDPAVTYRTDRGQSLTVALDDGSTLRLGGDTRLIVSLGRTERAAELRQGTVMFEVARDPARPFVIDTGDSRTEVLGTRFVLDRFSGGTELSVYSGRVRFSPADREGIEATAGQQVAVLAGRLGEVRRFEPDPAPWRSDWIETSGMSLGRLVEELNRWSDRPVELADPALKRLRVSGYFRLSETEKQLEGIALLHRLHLRRQADRYVLAPTAGDGKPY
ncbi:FecR family protein [Rhodospirillum centenum]|uniref:Sigma factor regulatory protein, FecR n=1 Tax=Rhodospirillum centenum (strain ATCC 51521 / SW) TaxID=414684 RepID=B6IYT8_RHOCS|nr:FecR domain-containing protein [Rhodospirillum centenum]ACJ01462.1 sigma factor regulatory protein, FecR [Rhodospirillum centenum SW]